MYEINSLLVLPRLRVQNANTISSPMTWGFPAMSAFMGAMQALERNLPGHIDLEFSHIGVICHDFSAQVTDGGYTRAFHLTRNPVGKDGGTAAIVEEGRAHLDITLVFAVRGQACSGTPEERSKVASDVADIVAGMRIAGGSVMPLLSVHSGRRHRPALIPLNDDPEQRDAQFKALRRNWLPGFALISRDDLLQGRWAELRSHNSEATILDAWLDLSRLNIDCEMVESKDRDDNAAEIPQWNIRRPSGWVVPIPIGYGGLSELYTSDTVLNARDTNTSFRFVESLYSMGQWISPHRLYEPKDLLWYVQNDVNAGLYRLCNTNHLAAKFQ